MPRIGTFYAASANWYIPYTISLNDLKTEYGRKSRPGTDISFLDYYRGNGLVPDTTLNSVASGINSDYVPYWRVFGSTSPDTLLPSSGALSLNVFRDSTRHRQNYTTMGDIGRSLLYGAHTVSGGFVGMPGNVWIGRGETAPFELLYQINLSNWFPLLPTIVNNTTSRNQYCLGTNNIYNPYTIADVPIFAWRSDQSKWSDKMVSSALGLTLSQIARAKRARRVWWDSVYNSMDGGVYYGFAILKAENFGDLGSAGEEAYTYANYPPTEEGRSKSWRYALINFNNSKKVEIFSNYDPADEWQDHGFTYKPTVTYSNPWPNSAGIGTYTLTNTGSAAFTRTGATYRDSGGLLSTLSDYSISIGTDDLVIPIVRSDNGFSGGGGGARHPFVAKFGLIESIQEVATY